MIKLRRGGPPTVLRRGPHRRRSDEHQRQDEVAAGIARAREAWKEYQANRKLDRGAVYGYLQVVFDLVQQWEKKDVAVEYSLEALKQAEFSIRMKPDPYARVIYCSSEEDDPQDRSKWAKVMQWVARHNVNARSFTEFVTKNGGLNKCAYLAADDFKSDWT